MFELSEQKQQLLRADGNLLIMGGPGSGKTTIALLKAKQVIEEEGLEDEQRVLLLSFARATITNIEQQARPLISPLTRNQRIQPTSKYPCNKNLNNISDNFSVHSC
jgi:superfamily I DNA/RNA helicase